MKQTPDDSVPSDPSCGKSRPRILLVATLRWPLAARAAIAFQQLGCSVQAWCPRGHPLESTHAVERLYRNRAIAPLTSLRNAIRAAAPDFMVPCDDDAALYLHRLYRQAPGDAQIRDLIRRSMGEPASCSRASSRNELMQLSRALGIRIPDNAPLAALADLESWSTQYGFPAVVKTDRSWGGFGVTVVGTFAEAREAFLLAKQPTLLRAFSQLILRRDWSFLLRWLDPRRPGVTIQKFIVGRPANNATACWQGEALAGVCVLALQTRTPRGPATVIQVIDNEEMRTAAVVLVRALGLSGFAGLDFIIEEGSGLAYLIEMNPRVTPIAHLALGNRQSLMATLHSRLCGLTTAPPSQAGIGDVIALFPGECLRRPTSAYLHSAFHDVPWSEMGLVRDCLEKPWEERGFAATLRARLRVAVLSERPSLLSLNQRPGEEQAPTIGPTSHHGTSRTKPGTRLQR